METIDIFRMMAPEFKDVTDDVVLDWIELIRPLVSRKKFGKVYNLALALLTAHKMKVNGLGDDSMGKLDDMLRVGSYSEGGVSISYAMNGGSFADTDADYRSTVYGLQFLDLRKKFIITIVSAGENDSSDYFGDYERYYRAWWLE